MSGATIDGPAGDHATMTGGTIGRAPATRAAMRRPLAPPKPWIPMLLLLALFGLAFASGMAGVSAIRPVYVLVCVGLSLFTIRRGPARHLEVAIALFMVTPFLRRVVDLNCGYDGTGVMLVGPMLFIAIPSLRLGYLLRPGSDAAGRYAPILLFAATVVYGAMLSLFQGDITSAASGTLKMIAPALYGIYLCEMGGRQSDLVDAATRTFAVIVPLMGLYGLLQYVDPPLWDRYWMIYSKMTSIGQPVAYEVRVFSGMNSPASFATFTIAGLLLFGFCRPGWTALILAGPSCLGLMLSLYRTAWVALAVGVMFCLLFSATRGRSLLITCCIFAAITLAVVATPFGDVIGDRLQTLNKPSEDGSGQERMQEYVTLFNAPDSTLFGIGYASADPGTPGAMPVDGLIVACWLSMGLVVGLVSIAAVVWIALRALSRTYRAPTRENVALGAIIIGSLTQIPLASIVSGELGFLFWIAIALTLADGNSGAAAARIPLAYRGQRFRPGYHSAYHSAPRSALVTSGLVS